MSGFNWTKFTKRITINAPADQIYRSWSTQDGLESWFLRLAEFKTPAGDLRQHSEPVQKNDHYKWLWFGYDDAMTEENDVLEMNGKDLFKFSFSGGCIVTVTAIEEKGETICELVQEMPMDDETEQRYFYIECGKGWTFYLANLKSILEGGIDLRNKNAAISNVINA
jgi:uncharacterized protein YndB with AHSA1/START domain